MSQRFGGGTAAARLPELRDAGPGLEAVLGFYDGLAPARIEDVIGEWRGGDLPTGHPLDGVLEPLGWYGKIFRSPDEVHPLVFRDRRGRFSVDPSCLPLSPLLRYGDLLRRPEVAGLARPVLRLRRTSRPRARLRMVEYRGVPTATMSYDTQPINDHFRLVDENTLIGLMDARGSSDHPFAFFLERVAAEGAR
ncbi:DUF4334 domain-containing protein [Marinactinospora endophytica]